MNCTAFRRAALCVHGWRASGPRAGGGTWSSISPSAAAARTHDSVVRRAILMARNLPPIEPSADFTSRSEARLNALSSRPLARLTRENSAVRRASHWCRGGRVPRGARLPRAGSRPPSPRFVHSRLAADAPSLRRLRSVIGSRGVSVKRRRLDRPVELQRAALRGLASPRSASRDPPSYVCRRLPTPPSCPLAEPIFRGVVLGAPLADLRMVGGGMIGAARIHRGAPYAITCVRFGMAVTRHAAGTSHNRKRKRLSARDRGISRSSLLPVR